MASLQTFPKEVRFAGGYSDAQKQLGNAVPSLLAEVVARAMSSQLLGRPNKRGKLLLSVPKSKLPCPSPESIEPVPEHYIFLRGTHQAHPCTGKGYRASVRTQLRNVASI
jgi:DNA (cytosine-5)-methyltransferase 1